MKKFFTLFLGILLLSFIVSCSFNNSSVESSTSISQPSQQQIANLTFEDLPVPTSMILDRENSFVYETSNYRTGVLYYTGNMSPIELSNFYKSQMSKYNWTLVSSIDYKSGSQLIFEKPGWIAVIRCEKGSFQNSRLIITIGPKGGSTSSTQN